MALAKYTLTNGQWKKISGAGQSGAAWLKSFSGVKPIIVIAHTDSAQTPADDIPVGSAVNLDVDIAYRLPFADLEISRELTADNVDDIFYATILNDGKTCEIISDFI